MNIALLILFAAFAVGLFYCAPVIICDGLDTFGAILRGEEFNEWEL